MDSTTIDQRINALLLDIIIAQMAYLSENGSHFQLLATCETPPDLGSEASVSLANPEGQSPSPVESLGFLPSTLPFQLSIDKSSGEREFGFTCTFRVVSDGTTYRKSVGFGYGSESTDGWTPTLL